MTSKKKRKESKEEQLRKTSTTASLLHNAVLLNPDFHKAVVDYNNGSPAAQLTPKATPKVTVQATPHPTVTVQEPVSPQPVMGTVLRPQLPRGRTPFQEWRLFRQQRQLELQQQEQEGAGKLKIQQEQQMQVEHPPPPFRHTPSPRLMRTPEPDYDTTSVGSAASMASRSSYRSSKEDLRPRQARRSRGKCGMRRQIFKTAF